MASISYIKHVVKISDQHPANYMSGYVLTDSI